ncbi:MAG: RagB/SusD family nutrient uptake outer membrane protein [Paludibacter sp.]|nr:RagB/SusD family nutrient uptake outer membrane protein [Paludibacter sp.]
MKNIIKIATIIFCGVAFSGCEDFLSRNPISAASPETFWKSKEDADLWLAGTYDALQTTLRTGVLDWGEARSDNFVSNGVGTMQVKVTTNTLVAGDADLVVLTSWKNIYTTIARCNFGLKYTAKMIENNVDGNSETYKDYMGQYYGLRALMYFYATRVWGRVPIVGNDPIESLSQNIYFERSPIDSCKKVILNDLDSCISNISPTNRKYYFSLGAAYALKTDVHMWFKEYDLAEQSIQKLEALNYYKWVLNSAEWKKIFTEPDGSTETIFSLYFEQLQDNGGSGIAQRLGSSSNTSTFSIAPDLFQILVNRNRNGNIDTRWQLCFDTITYNSTQSTLQDKCGKYYPWDDKLVRTGESRTGGFVYEPVNMCNAKIPIYRYADIELLKAEIYYRRGEYQKALNIVNTARMRVGYYVLAKLADFTNPDSGVLDCIMEERRIEFLGEGKRWFDLIEVSDVSYDYFHKIMDPVMAARSGSVSYTGENEGRILFPIESTAFAANPLLRGDQNLPYSE